jgi:hypothetical protein
MNPEPSPETAVATLSKAYKLDPATIMRVALTGDMKGLSQGQLMQIYLEKCNRVGLDPSTYPFQLLELNGKLIWYATKACAHGLTKKHNLSLNVMETEYTDDIAIVSYKCTGLIPGTTNVYRSCDDVGVVDLKGLAGERRANAIMKAHTKAKRRATLSWAGLGENDEEEMATVAGAKPVPFVMAEPVKMRDDTAAAFEQMQLLMKELWPEIAVATALKRLQVKTDSAASQDELHDIVTQALSDVTAAHAKKFKAGTEEEVHAIPKPTTLENVLKNLDYIAGLSHNLREGAYIQLASDVYDMMYQPASAAKLGPRHASHWVNSKKKHTKLGADPVNAIIALATDAEALMADEEAIDAPEEEEDNDASDD